MHCGRHAIADQLAHELAIAALGGQINRRGRAFLAAMDLAQQYGQKMHLGVFYRNPEPPPTYGDLVKERQTLLSKDALPKERILDLFIKK